MSGRHSRGKREAYRKLNPKSSPGVDGQTWQDYGENLDERIKELSARLKRMGHRPQAVLRRYISKEIGKQRPIARGKTESPCSTDRTTTRNRAKSTRNGCSGMKDRIA